jgi:hypothetical protein
MILSDHHDTIDTSSVGLDSRQLFERVLDRLCEVNEDASAMDGPRCVTQTEPMTWT